MIAVIKFLIDAISFALLKYYITNVALPISVIVAISKHFQVIYCVKTLSFFLKNFVHSVILSYRLHSKYSFLLR